ncbi:MAG: 3-hydroxy-3-methylglutaryl-CoA lyase, partial [Clostridium sp.]|nr:3-hydroxy-3-methylglutaryl-CoA lyase [Clostridium sp.]
PWGYNMFFYVAASNDCHPNYVSYLMEKRTLSVKSINEILGKLEGEKKLLYDEEYIENLYLKYQKIDVDDKEDFEKLTNELSGKKVLLLGPGTSLLTQVDKVKEYIDKEKPVVISINFIPNGVKTDYVFLSNSKRYVQLATSLATYQKHIKVIATSNVTKTSGSFDFTLKYSDLLDYQAEIADNSVVMLLQVLIRVKVANVALAGFDGYRGNEKNYIRANMEYDFGEEKARKHNAYMTTVLEGIKKEVNLEFITDTLYKIS